MLGVHLVHVPPGPRCLGGHDLEKLPQPIVQDALGESTLGTCPVGQILSCRLVSLRFGSFDQVGHLQLFKHQHVMLLDEHLGVLMVEVSPLVAYFAVCLCHLRNRLFPPMGATLAPGQAALLASQVRLRFPEQARRLKKGAIGERGKVGDSQVNAHFTLHMRQRVGLLYLAGERRVPLARFVFDGTGLDLALDGSVQLDLERTNLGEGHALAIGAQGRAPLRIGK